MDNDKLHFKTLATDELLPLSNVFDERVGKVLSMPLLTKDHKKFIQPPPLLPAETLILQQDRVTCINTLNHVATGAIHLTNYRIIFAGKYILNKNHKYLNQLNASDLAKLGCQYREKNSLLRRVPSGLMKLVSKSGRSFRGHHKENSSITAENFTFWKGVSLEDEDCSLSDDQLRLPVNDDNEVMISLPILSLYKVKRFHKQYFRHEKLNMLNDGIKILTTNFHSVKLCLSDQGSYDADELIKIIGRHALVKSHSSIFAYCYAKALVLPQNRQILEDRSACNFYKLENEVQRLCLTKDQWNLIEQTSCAYYPNIVITHLLACSNEKLAAWSKYHINGCFPILVWKDKVLNNFLLRAATTVAPRGYMDFRCHLDEEIMKSLNSENCHIKIFSDCCPLSVLLPNGLSVKEGGRSYYPQCGFVNLNNLPELCSTQASAMKLLIALDKSDDSHFLSKIEDSGWLQEIEIILSYSNRAASALTKGSSVLLAIGSGTERVAQISCLVQILVDPYYRTMDGFQVLVQKEWISIQHPFLKRNQLSFSNEDNLSPLFLQFLDCVWQITDQFQMSFEFNTKLLEFLAVHSYSGCFGTFLEKESNSSNSVSLWTYVKVMNERNQTFLSSVYDQNQNYSVLQPRVSLPHLNVWSWFTRLKKEESLLFASMVAEIEVEKLQHEYKDLMQKHLVLLKQLSRADECSSAVAFNSSALKAGYVAAPPSAASCNSQINFGNANTFVKGKSSFWKPYSQSNSSKEPISSFFFTDHEFVAADILNTPFTSNNINLPAFGSLVEYLKTKGIRVGDSILVKFSRYGCSGYLVKRGYNVKSWKKRWFVLDLAQKCVAYFESPTVWYSIKFLLNSC